MLTGCGARLHPLKQIHEGKLAMVVIRDGMTADEFGRAMSGAEDIAYGNLTYHHQYIDHLRADVDFGDGLSAATTSCDGVAFSIYDRETGTKIYDVTIPWSTAATIYNLKVSFEISMIVPVPQCQPQHTMVRTPFIQIAGWQQMATPVIVRLHLDEIRHNLASAGDDLSMEEVADWLHEIGFRHLEWELYQCEEVSLGMLDASEYTQVHA